MVEADSVKAALNVLTWDTEGGDRINTNLLRAPVFLKVVLAGQTYCSSIINVNREDSAQSKAFHIPVGTDCEIEWSIENSGTNMTMSLWAVGPGAINMESAELIFPWNPRVTPTTIIASYWLPGGTARAPVVISAPDFGQLVMNSSVQDTMMRLQGSRSELTADLVVELPGIAQGQRYDLSLSPLYLPAPAGLENTDLWTSIRRSWFNAWQPTAQWGDQDSTHSSPGAVLGNNVVSDVVSFSLFLYSDHALCTHFLSAGVSVMDSIRQTIDWWLDSRTQSKGQVIGYWDYPTFLDANPSILISAWDYVEATGDLDWLHARMDQLDQLGEHLAECDVDGDGLCEAIQSGNYGTLFQPQRSSNWFDGVNFGFKDGYANALIYRAWRCMADLCRRIEQTSLQARYLELASHLRGAYAPNLWNSTAGWFGCWKSEDGTLHDYISPVVNGMAIECGLVPPALGRRILNSLWNKIHEVGFSRFDLGVPTLLLPIRADDYIQPDGFASPHLADGSDTFQQYENGGISAGQTLHFLAAHYLSELPRPADKVLFAMIGRQLHASGF